MDRLYRRETNKAKRNVKRILLPVIILAAAAALSACTTYNSFYNTFIEKSGTDPEQVITIGVFEPQTGRNADRGTAELKGIELANSIYNNVNGYRVVLTKVDTQSSVSAARTAVQGLIEMKPVAIIGSAGEATSLAASELIEEAGIPAITPSATNPLITQGNRYYFRASITESQMGQGLAEYAIKEKNSSKIGIITLKNDSSVAAMTDGFESKIKSLVKKKNRAVCYETEIMPTEDELKIAVAELGSRNVDVCFAPLGAENMDAFFTMIEDRNLTDITFLGLRSWGDEAFINMMAAHPDIKIVFPYESVLTDSGAGTDTITEEAQRFKIEYAGRYGNEDLPTYNAALGYDAYLIIINAIHNAGSLEGEDVRNALLELSNLKCSTGSFAFDEIGNVVRPVSLSALKDGKPVTEYICESETKSKTLEVIEDQQEESQEESQSNNQ